MLNSFKFSAGYIEAAEWADCGPDHETHEHQWSPDLLAQMATDCAAFIAATTDIFSRVAELAPEYSDERAGHDFWLTRNGHGAGFWDREELEHHYREPERKHKTLGEALSDAAHAFGPFTLYVGDDGLVYGMKG
jgi:hypothetical protein